MVAKIRGILSKKEGKRVKVGHAGTLDPLAEGVLIVLTGKDAKEQDRFMQMRKEYLAEIAFGVVSLTYDLESELLIQSERRIPSDLKDELQEILPKFIGEIKQKVPLYSAVKVKGRPLYKRARENTIKESETPVKKIHIYAIKLLAFAYKEIPFTSGMVKLPVAKVKIACGKGTYIRSLANAMGDVLGTGAVLISLVRTKVGEYSVEKAERLEDLITKL